MDKAGMTLKVLFIFTLFLISVGGGESGRVMGYSGGGVLIKYQDYEKSVSVTGHVGGGVNIRCKYPQSHSSDPKFLCRRVGSADCTYKSSVKESRRWINEGKLSLHDNRAKQIFTVSFNSLTEGDSGEYWCGAESDWTSDHGYKAYITQINLRVTSPDVLPQSSTHISSSTTQPTTSSTPETASSPLSATGSPPPAFPVSSVVTGVSVVVLLLLIGLLFFVVTLRKRNKTRGPASIQSQSHRGSSDNHPVSCDVYVYEEVKDIPGSDAGVSTVYSAVELLTNPSEPSQTLYGNVQLSTNPSEPSQTLYGNIQ
ncbi:CMRF35-like molecule 8 isoform X3 [Pygocentrus nattereri]|uniref:CMRF35-like molecule 8 isoform X3 n=1 Tax=Pygocentrus nattereri TaxID=42514 RepID=UPI0008142D01|nr:CMRF35-like molecule 8 isoform X3 [Pygocentrus nattereri]